MRSALLLSTLSATFAFSVTTVYRSTDSSGTHLSLDACPSVCASSKTNVPNSGVSQAGAIGAVVPVTTIYSYTTQIVEPDSVSTKLFPIKGGQTGTFTILLQGQTETVVVTTTQILTSTRDGGAVIAPGAQTTGSFTNSTSTVSTVTASLSSTSTQVASLLSSFASTTSGSSSSSASNGAAVDPGMQTLTSATSTVASVSAMSTQSSAPSITVDMSSTVAEAATSTSAPANVSTTSTADASSTVSATVDVLTTSSADVSSTSSVAPPIRGCTPGDETCQK